MKAYVITVMVIFHITVLKTAAQEDIQLTSRDSLVQSSWVAGLGINIVDDTASPFFDNVFSIGDTWNTVPYPSRFSFGRYTRSGLGFEAVATVNKYKIGKIVDGRVNDRERDYYALDGQISYDINKLVGETGWFDPYIHTGAGYSSIGGDARVTWNAGFGFNTWFTDRWGLNFNTMGKWGIKEGTTKQLQHSAGVVHRFGVDKALSQRGEEKLALIEALEKEQQRVSDSINEAQSKKEAQLLAERLEKEKEKNRLLAEEKARLDAENNRKNALTKEMDELGGIYFELNSSYLNMESKNTLDKMVMFLADNPTVKLRVGSHTDSRGTDEYNMWLSQRRVKRTVDYLISKGIAGERLNSAAYGEERLANHCADRVPCSESEHQENRRSEFKIVDY